MLWKKNTKSVNSQLALRRINRRRTTELGSFDPVLPKSETNTWRAVQSHCHTVRPCTDTEVSSGATARGPDDMELRTVSERVAEGPQTA